MAGMAKMLNTADPTIVASPTSPSVTKVPTQLTINSGDDVAMAIIVAPATSSSMLSSEKFLNLISKFSIRQKLKPTLAYNFDRFNEVFIADYAQHPEAISRRDDLDNDMSIPFCDVIYKFC